MKKIKIQTKTIGCDYPIKGNILISVNGKNIVDNKTINKWDIYSIVNEALEVEPMKVEVVVYFENKLRVCLKTKDNNSICFTEDNFKLPKRLSKREIRKSFYKLEGFLKRVEKWVKKNKKCTREFCFEIGG